MQSLFGLSEKHSESSEPGKLSMPLMCLLLQKYILKQSKRARTHVASMHTSNTSETVQSYASAFYSLSVHCTRKAGHTQQQIRKWGEKKKAKWPSLYVMKRELRNKKIQESSLHHHICHTYTYHLASHMRLPFRLDKCKWFFTRSTKKLSYCGIQQGQANGYDKKAHWEILFIHTLVYVCKSMKGGTSD